MARPATATSTGDPGRGRQSDGQQRVRHVVGTGQRHRHDVLVTAGGLHRDGGRAGVGRDRPQDRPVSVTGRRDRRHAFGTRPGALRHLRAPLVVDADHRFGGAHRGLGVEEPGLGVEVVVHRGMEVEVVLRQVGESSDREAAAVHPAQFEGVARDLHDHGVDPAFEHNGEQTLQVRSFRGGQRARNAYAVHPDLHGADQTHGPAGRAQRGLREIGGGGLAGGPGDADQGQLRRRVAVDQGRDAAQHAARRGVYQHRHIEAGLPHLLLPARIGQDRGRTGRHRRRRELRPVHPAARESREQIPRRRLLGAQRRTGHGRVRTGQVCTRP